MDWRDVEGVSSGIVSSGTSIVERVVSLGLEPELELEVDDKGGDFVDRIDVVEVDSMAVKDTSDPVMTICSDRSFPIPS